MVAACLVKDPKNCPSSEKLLKHPLFKHAKTCDYLERTILDGLSPLGDRFMMLKAKEADFLVQNKDLYRDKNHLSQQEYIHGISAWNFNLEDLKNQAALMKFQVLKIQKPQNNKTGSMVLLLLLHHRKKKCPLRYTETPQNFQTF
ncbi:hypothetical protein LXL04_011722 [Taraxacum kok-saghyz]